MRRSYQNQSQHDQNDGTLGAYTLPTPAGAGYQ